MSKEESKRQWRQIRIMYNDNSEETIYKTDMKKLDAIQDVLEAFADAKDMKERLTRLLG
jgi:hypothetical protein